jgi:hypothetical protein
LPYNLSPSDSGAKVEDRKGETSMAKQVVFGTIKHVDSCFYVEYVCPGCGGLSESNGHNYSQFPARCIVTGHKFLVIGLPETDAASRMKANRLESLHIKSRENPDVAESEI